MKEVLKNWWLVLIKGIILVLLSFFVFRHPVSALVGLALYIGISLITTGILLIITSLSNRKQEQWGWQLAEGAIDVLFGFILLSNPAITATVFPFVVGFWIMIYGVIIFINSFGLKKDGEKSWWMNLITGILTVIMGYFITFNLVAGAITITFWIGLGFLFFGLLNISIAFRMKKLKSAAN